MNSESIYGRINRVLSWKRILTFNVLLLLVLVVPLSVRLAQEDTENRTGAAGEVVTPSPEPPANYPVNPPQIERVQTYFGKVGDTVVLLGDNFGDYRWGSTVFVGNVQANADDIVRWSNRVVEVNIPAGAKTGKVWIVVNGKRANWSGNMLLYDVNLSPELRLDSGGNKATLSIEKGERIARGTIEFGYTPISISASGIGGIEITGQTTATDSLGKILKVDFNVTSNLKRIQTNVIELLLGGGGNVNIIRAEMYDSSGRLIEIFSDPLKSSVSL